MRRFCWFWGTTAVSLSLLLLLIFTNPVVQAQDTSPTPTVDRLAAPPTVPAPTQADDGAQLYWLHCQPCHGDQGQGLTDEWRTQYPPEHQNCWASGCHGNQPYTEGFTLPTAVPAIIGAESLTRFETFAQVYQYTRIKMPFEFPGVLTEAEYQAITAFLAREHGFTDEAPLTLEKMGQFRLRPMPTPSATAVPTRTNPPGTGNIHLKLIATIILLTLILIGGYRSWRHRHS